jgi:coenzyme F420 hydrogenase subunit beta
MRGDKFEIFLKQGERRELDLAAVKRYMDQPCKVCSDFTAELADISAGAVGSPAGRSTMLIRTQTGVEALDMALKSGKISAVGLKEVSPGIESVRQEAKLKKESAQLAIDELRRGEKVLPAWLRERMPGYEEPIEPVREICPV